MQIVPFTGNREFIVEHLSRAKRFHCPCTAVFEFDVTEPLLSGSLREVGLGALVEIVGFEYMLSRVLSRIARFLQGYRGIEEADLIWFTHHSEVDIIHAEEGLDTIENYVSYYGFDEDEARDIIDAALRENVFIKRYFGVEAAAKSRSMV